MNTPNSTKAELSVPSTGHSIIAATTKKDKFQGTTTLIEAEPLTLTTTKSEILVDSREISRQLNVKSRASIAMIEKYADKFKSHGLLTFKKAVMQRKGQPERYALLNYDQAIFLTTLSRNNDRVVGLKSKLVKAFSEARKALDLRTTEYLPGYHELHDAIHERAVDAAHERHDHINFNRLVNKIAGIGPGQRAGANAPTQAMMIVSNLMALQAVKSAPSGQAYAVAKAATAPLLALTAGNTLQIGGLSLMPSGKVNKYDCP